MRKKIYPAATSKYVGLTFEEQELLISSWFLTTWLQEVLGFTVRPKSRRSRRLNMRPYAALFGHLLWRVWVLGKAANPNSTLTLGSFILYYWGNELFDIRWPSSMIFVQRSQHTILPWISRSIDKTIGAGPFRRMYPHTSLEVVPPPDRY